MTDPNWDGVSNPMIDHQWAAPVWGDPIGWAQDTGGLDQWRGLVTNVDESPNQD